MYYMSDLYFVQRDGSLTVRTRSIPRTGWAHRLYNTAYRLRLDPLLRGTGEVFDPIPRILSSGERGLYIRDNGSGEVWSLGHGLQGADDEFTCSFGHARIEWTAHVHGYLTRLTVSLSDKAPLEMWHLSIDLPPETPLPDWRVFYQMPLPGFAGHIGVRAGYDHDYEAVFCDHTEYYTEFQDIDRIQTTRHVALLFSLSGIAGFDTDPDAFDGTGIARPTPAAVEQGCTGSSVEGADACLAAEFLLHTTPNGSPGVSWGVAAASRTELGAGAHTRFRELLGNAAPDNAPAEPPRPFTIHLSDSGSEAFLTHWLGRQIDYMATTARGERAPCIRNVLQDAQGLSAQNPVLAQQLLQDVCRVQGEDGYLPHSMSLNRWNAPRGLGNLQFHDAAVWLPIAVDHYIRTTGDFALLGTELPYSEGGSNPSPVAEHLTRAIDYLERTTGAHGLPLLGDGDWNDPLNGPGRRGKGESVWLGEAFVYATRRLADLFEAAGLPGTKDLRARADTMDSRIATDCWTGSRFIRGFDDDGRPFGHDDDEYGSVFLNAQTWAVMAGIGTESQRTTSLETVDRALDTAFGPITLAPTFPAYDERIGKITVKPRGANENGSVYCHAAAFKALADACAGRATKAAATLERIIPGAQSCRMERTGQLPLYVPNFYYGPDAGPAAGRSSMLDSTGTAAWLSILVSDYICGLYPDYAGVRIRPCLDPSWLPIRFERTLRGARYRLTCDLAASGTETETRISVNGEELASLHIPYAEPGSTTDIHVRYPKKQIEHYSTYSTKTLTAR